MKCSKCGKELYEHELTLSNGGLICELCELDKNAPKASSIDGVTIVAALMAMVPFFFHYFDGRWMDANETNEGSMTDLELLGHWRVPADWNGGIFDFVGVLFGGAAIGGCIAAILRARRSGSRRYVRWVTAGMVAIVGLWQLLYGFGYLP